MDTYKNISRLREGSYEDFKILYEKYHDHLYGFIFGITRSETLTEDVVQETFMKVWINRETIQPYYSFKSYLFTVSRNRIIDIFRKQVNNLLFEDYLEFIDEQNGAYRDHPIETQIDFDLFAERLRLAKEKLPDRQREIFELSKEQGFSSVEISKIMNISEQTVYNQLSTVMRTLRKELGTSGLVVLFLLDFVK